MNPSVKKYCTPGSKERESLFCPGCHSHRQSRLVPRTQLLRGKGSSSDQSARLQEEENIVLWALKQNSSLRFQGAHSPPPVPWGPKATCTSQQNEENWGRLKPLGEWDEAKRLMRGEGRYRSAVGCEVTVSR